MYLREFVFKFSLYCLLKNNEKLVTCCKMTKHSHFIIYQSVDKHISSFFFKLNLIWEMQKESMAVCLAKLS